MAEPETVPSVETVLNELRQRLPFVSIKRLVVKYPADDDNLWFIKTEALRDVQIESHPDVRPPFLIEGDGPDRRCQTSEIAEAVEVIVAWLDSP